MLSILIVDDDGKKPASKARMFGDVASYSAGALGINLDVNIADTYEEALEAMKLKYDLAMFDLRLDENDVTDERGLGLFEQYRSSCPSASVILYSGTSSAGFMHDGIPCLPTEKASKELVAFIQNHKEKPEIIEGPKPEKDEDDAMAIPKSKISLANIFTIIALIFGAGIAYAQLDSVNKRVDSHCAAQQAREEKYDAAFTELKIEIAVLSETNKELKQSVESLTRILHNKRE